MTTTPAIGMASETNSSFLDEELVELREKDGVRLVSEVESINPTTATNSPDRIPHNNGATMLMTVVDRITVTNDRNYRW